MATQKSVLDNKKKEAQLAREIRNAEKETAKIVKEIADIKKDSTKSEAEKNRLIDEQNKKLNVQNKETSILQKRYAKINAENKRIAKIVKETRSWHRDILSSVQKQPAVFGVIGDLSKGILDNAVEIAKLEKKGTKAAKKEATLRRGIAETLVDISANTANIATDEFTTYDLSKKIAWARREGHTGLVLQLEAMSDLQAAQKRLNTIALEGAEAVKKPFDTLKEKLESIPGGSLLSNLIGFDQIADQASSSFIEGFKNQLFSGITDQSIAEKVLGDPDKYGPTGQAKDQGKQKKGGGLDMRLKVNKEAAAKARGDMEQELLKNPFQGVTDWIGGATKKIGEKFAEMPMHLKATLGLAVAAGGAMLSMLNTAREMGISFASMPKSAFLFKAEAQALLDEFGSLEQVSNKTLASMKWQSFWTGVQATDMAKVMMLQQSITGDTKEMALDRQAKFMKDIKKEGLSASKVMGDLAANADMFANFAKDGGKNMEEAAKQAAKMGLDLSATNSVAEKLLNFEESIQAEQEASMLLGRSVNLDKARQLAYSGDLAEMMAEVKKQAGGEAEFVKTQDSANASTSSGIGKWMMWTAIALGVLGAIAGALIGSGVLAGIGAGMFTGMGIGLVGGLALGAGLGAAAYGVSKMFGSEAGDVMSPAKGRTQISPKEGGLYNLSPNDDFMAAPGLLNNFGTQNISQASANSDAKSDKIIELLTQANDDRITGNKKLGRDMSSAFINR